VVVEKLALAQHGPVRVKDSPPVGAALRWLVMIDYHLSCSLCPLEFESKLLKTKGLLECSLVLFQNMLSNSGFSGKKGVEVLEKLVGLRCFSGATPEKTG
jgi:hypothetical protein